MIKDSGDRTEFETGAKRDMHAGKGRMDLLPWYGIMEVSKHCEEGALKYGEHNVDKGIPLHSLLDSASRHLAKDLIVLFLNLPNLHSKPIIQFRVRLTLVQCPEQIPAGCPQVILIIHTDHVLCPNCEATIIKENGQICDGVAWRVCVPNEKIKLKCCYCNRAVIVSIKDIVDERLKGETDE